MSEGGAWEQVSRHAGRRMIERNISLAAVEAALDHGRRVHTRGAVVAAIGRKEVRRARQEGIDLSRFEGVQVVCLHDELVLTVYRNRDFSQLKVGLGRRRRRERRWMQRTSA
jgi:hypothetical protein